MRLTDIAVRSLAPPKRGQRIYRDDSVPGFGVRVSQGGSKTFVLVVGRERQFVSIGRYPVIGLADARQIARERLAERTLGKHRPTPRRMADALETFFEEKAAKNKASSLAITRGILNMHFKHLHARYLSEITTTDIARTTDALISGGTPSAANHALVAAKTFFRWCGRRGYIEHFPIEKLERPARLNTRDRVLTDVELRTVWKVSDDCGQFGTIVKLLIATGQRRSEIGSLKAEWCSLAVTCMGESLVQPKFEKCDSRPQNTICIPGTHTKNGRIHMFPVGQLATSILKSASENTSPTAPTAFLFPARGGSGSSFNGWSKGKAQLDKKAAELFAGTGEKVQPWTLHDLRRTYATNLQRLGIRLEVIEALLNHVSGTRAGIVGVYQRHRYEAEMREAVNNFDDWFAKVILAE